MQPERATQSAAPLRVTSSGPVRIRVGEDQCDLLHKAQLNSMDWRTAKMSDERDDENDVGVAVKPKAKTKRPSMYKVLLLNDDYTPMEFVVHVLERFFSMPHDAAVQIMLAVHNQGVAVVGVFTYEVAETKVTQVMDYARQHQHPLQCAMEKE